MIAGIVTFHKADNFGAVLQAYALQKTLENLGADSEFLEFQTPAKNAESLNEPVNGPRAFAARLREAGKARTALFDEFRAKYLRCSPPIAAEKSDELNGIYDVFITGSDQVWNLNLPEADERYFLPFAPPDKRISYAASFGTAEIADKLKEWYKDRLNGFRSISVREESGKEIVKELTGKGCAVCLDPVLLLTRAEWLSLVSPADEPPYLFLYMVDYDADLAARAEKEAEERGLELKVAAAGFIPKYGIESWNGVSVEKWLSLIYNSAGVFTNSFHCTAFAMIFEKPAHTAMLKDGLARRNGRLEELLRLGTEDQKNGGVSAEKFALRIRDRREDSINYLRGAICMKR